MMNTSVREHTARQPPEAWCRGKDPHTGPKAFVAMRQKRGDNAPQDSTHRGEATRPSPEATIPRGRDQ